MSTPQNTKYSASPLDAATRLASYVARMALWPVTEPVVVTGRLERRARSAAGDLAGRAGLAVLDAVVASPYTKRAVDRVLESPLAEHAIAQAVSGPLVEATARDLAGHAVVERVADELL